jgi:hypothetical protein
MTLLLFSGRDIVTGMKTPSTYVGVKVGFQTRSCK